MGNILVDPAQVGQTAELLVYAAYQSAAEGDPFHFMLDSSSHVLPWDENLSHLVVFQSGVILNTEQPVELFGGTLVFPPGELVVHFGYRLPTVTVVMSKESMVITIK